MKSEIHQVIFIIYKLLMELKKKSIVSSELAILTTVQLLNPMLCHLTTYQMNINLRQFDMIGLCSVLCIYGAYICVYTSKC